MLTKTTIVDARTAWVVEQQLHDAAGQLLALVKLSDQRLDPASGVWLPHSIELAIPSGNLSMRLSVERWDVNAPLPADAFVKPQQPGFPDVDLSDPRNLPQAAPLAGGAAPADPMRTASNAAAPGSSPVALARSRYGERPPADPERDSGWRPAD
jgi:hypothetical protein